MIFETSRPWAAAAPGLNKLPGPVKCGSAPLRSGAGLMWQVVYGPKLSGRPGQGAPDRNTQKMPLRTRRSFTVLRFRPGIDHLSFDAGDLLG